MSNKKFVVVLVVLAVFGILVGVLKNRFYIEGKDAKYWHEVYVAETATTLKLRNCVNTGTILSPRETYGTLTALVKRVRNNCQ